MLQLVSRCTFSPAIATTLHVLLFLRMGSMWSLAVSIEVLVFGMLPQVNRCESMIILKLSAQLPIHRMANTLPLVAKTSWLDSGKHPQGRWCMNSWAQMRWESSSRRMVAFCSQEVVTEPLHFGILLRGKRLAPSPVMVPPYRR